MKSSKQQRKGQWKTLLSTQVSLFSSFLPNHMRCSMWSRVKCSYIMPSVHIMCLWCERESKAESLLLLSSLYPSLSLIRLPRCFLQFSLYILLLFSLSFVSSLLPSSWLQSLHYIMSFISCNLSVWCNLLFLWNVQQLNGLYCPTIVHQTDSIINKYTTYY